jgi:hypothetical protein
MSVRVSMQPRTCSARGWTPHASPAGLRAGLRRISSFSGRRRRPCHHRRHSRDFLAPACVTESFWRSGPSRQGGTTLRRRLPLLVHSIKLVCRCSLRCCAQAQAASTRHPESESAPSARPLRIPVPPRPGGARPVRPGAAPLAAVRVLLLPRGGFAGPRRRQDTSVGRTPHATVTRPPTRPHAPETPSQPLPAQTTCAGQRIPPPHGAARRGVGRCGANLHVRVGHGAEHQPHRRSVPTRAALQRQYQRHAPRAPRRHTVPSLPPPPPPPARSARAARTRTPGSATASRSRVRAAGPG